MVLIRPSRWRLPIFTLMVLVIAGAAPPKKLIEFGWDEPDTAFLRRHVRERETSPFDGCVFHANVVEKDGKVVNFAWHGWGFGAALDRGVAAGDRGPESDPDSIGSRTTSYRPSRRLVRRLRLDRRQRPACREGRPRRPLPGILFDVEQYRASFSSTTRARRLDQTRVRRPPA